MPGISALLDSDMEDNTNILDENSILSSASEGGDKQSSVPAKKTKRRHRVTMPKPKGKISKTSPAPVARKPTKKAADAKRKAIEAQIDDSILGEQTAEDVLQETEAKPRSRGRPAAKNKATTATKSRAAQIDENDGVQSDDEHVVAQSSHAPGKPTKQAPKPVRTTKIPTQKMVTLDSATGTQQSVPMDIDTDLDELEVTASKPAPKQKENPRARAIPATRRRAGSASDTERGDSNLRRRLGDITRKFENIDNRYQLLKEVGIHEANLNIEKLRKQCETTTEASNNLIASLKQELASQAPLVSESRKLKREALEQTSKIEQLTANNSTLKASLLAAQNDIKTLQAKLAAARSQSVESAPGKVPGSAIKSQALSRSAAASTTEAAQIAQMKLDLYGDLTGLLVHSVKRTEDGDTYDCIQTGRNGTLHFKLFIDQEDAKSASFQETEFLYTPFLDADRDRDMIELMPAYLTEDITFARQNAAKFYQRVVDTLTRKVSDE